MTCIPIQAKVLVTVMCFVKRFHITVRVTYVWWLHSSSIDTGILSSVNYIALKCVHSPSVSIGTVTCSKK